MKDGPFPPTDMYGIKTANICGLPLEIIEEAERTYRVLEQAKMGADSGDSTGPTTEEKNTERKKRLLHHLLALRYAELEYPGEQNGELFGEHAADS